MVQIDIRRKIYQSQQTVFTISELSQILGETNRDTLKARLSYYVKKGDLVRVRRGMYAKNEHFDIREVAMRIDTPSYISFETILRDAGALFQYDDAVFVAAQRSREVIVCGQKIIFRKIKDLILFNTRGVQNTAFVSNASPERAFLDMLYLFAGYGIDNPQALNWKICEQLLPIYQNRRMERDFLRYQKNI